MAKLGKNLIIAGAAVVIACIGGGLAAMHYLPGLLAPKSAAGHQSAAAAPQKQIYFADLSDIVVSLPAEADASSTAYVEFGVQFSTYDPNALTSFATYRPIIKAAVINLLLNETSAQLQDQKIRTGLIKSCLDISNAVLAANANYHAAPPFVGAYITNLVIQD